MKRLLIILFIIGIVGVISWYFKYKLNECKDKNIIYTTKVLTMMTQLIDSNISKRDLNNMNYSIIVSNLNYLNNKKYTLEFFCEFWKIDKIKRNVIRENNKSEVIEKLNKICGEKE